MFIRFFERLNKMINKINRLNFSAISSKLNENNINNDTEIPEINNKANFQRLINDFKTSYRTNRYWGNGGNHYVSLPEKSMTIMEQLEKPILDNIDYNIFGSRPQLSISFTKSNITYGDFECLTVIGSTVIAGSGPGSNRGLFYSEDNGHTWNQSNITSEEFRCLIVIGNTVIAGSDDDKGLYYSEDNGHTWNQSNITTGYFRCLTVIGSTVITGEIYTNAARGLFYSEDNGHTWNQSNITSGKFISLMVIGSTVIAGAGSDSSRGLFYSEDNGHTWQSSNITSTKFRCLTVIGSAVIAGSGSDNGLYYSEDKGKTWNQSNITDEEFDYLTVIGNTVIAGGGYANGLYYSEDNGHTWNQSNITDGRFDCLAVIYSKNTSVCTCIGSSSGLLYSESISEPLEFKEEREDAISFLNSSDPKNEQIVYNSILSKLFLDWLDYTLVKDCSINKNYIKYKDEAIVKESIDNNILTNNMTVYGNGPYFKFTEKYSC